jgi:Helicase conserved C-terminal domain
MHQTNDKTLSRQHLLDAIHADLIGPFRPQLNDEPVEEVLDLPPSRWYLTGFLAPQDAREIKADSDVDAPIDDELAAGADEDDEEADAADPSPKRRQFFPASMGLSVFLPPGSGGSVEATVRWADYEPVAHEDDKRAAPVWRRKPCAPAPVELPLDAKALIQGVPVPGVDGVRLVGQLREATAPGLPAGTHALAVFVVNERETLDRRLDQSYMFQVELELRSDIGFVPRPDRTGEGEGRDPDHKLADLQFRSKFDYAVGHGISVEIPEEQRSAAESGQPIHAVRTTWMPTHEVRRVVTHSEDGVVVAMEELAQLEDADAVRSALMPLVDAYGVWFEQQAAVPLDSPNREKTRTLVLQDAQRAKDRIQSGIERLANDPELLEAFRIANSAMATSALKRSPERYSDDKRPEWRLFQLAFVLLNIDGTSDPSHDDRDNVELIFFPTGGGKTEAYLGVIAFVLVLRRLRGQQRPDKGLGVAVILRYTLRLLTLDQLGRAATLICALEVMRRQDPEKLGDVRFTVGLWVGRTATANTMGQVKKKIDEYKASTWKDAPSPCPLTRCPWCGTEIDKNTLTYTPSKGPTEVTISCNNFRECDFSQKQHRDGLPVLFVDEHIYRELPSFIVATVDKFAMMPWRGETGMLFGRAQARDGRQFFGPMDAKPPRTAEALLDGLHPPELIVQDELHLISGPLGTMVGLYETAIEALCSRSGDDGKTFGPKILAATATVRRAREQIRSLFGRGEMALFPPPGIDDSETWFARVDHKSPGRLYLGVAAPGRSIKAISLRVYVALLCAAQKLYDQGGSPDQLADAYMTIAGYFNSLRELGGMRRLVEDDVRVRCSQVEKRLPASERGRDNPWFQNRKIQSEPVELTSRESTAKIAVAKARLDRPHADESHVDVLLASNMISVGVDIERLGLMVVCGQPKTTSEYIQATSRVGRLESKPGLVVTCLNVHKPRDRSHYERFAAYHDSFYRQVEAQSLTPFSGPALERGLVGTLVAMVRLLDPAMTPPAAAMDLGDHRALAEQVVKTIAQRAGRQPRATEQTVSTLEQRGKDLLDAWEMVIDNARQGAGKRSYSPFDKAKDAGKALLWTTLDEDDSMFGQPEAKFSAPTSMRDVEQTTHLWLERGKALGGRG